MTDVPTNDWSTLPPRRAPATPPRRIAPVVVPLLVVAALWVGGAHEVAIVVLVLAGVVTAATLASPSIRARLDRAAGWVGHHVGRALTFVLLGLVQIVVFTPIAAFARLLRSDPMDPLGGRRVDSRWLARDRNERPLPDRPYGDERYRRNVAGATVPVGSLRWLRGAVGAIVLLLLADIAIGSLVVRIDRERVEEPGLDGPVFGFDPLAQEALREQPNATSLFAELGQVGIGDPDPFLGWRFPDEATHVSDLVTVDGGIRRTLPEPSGAGSTVWFFGGSTMYGSGQADDATIASVLAERLAASGITIDAVNFGHPAYAQWQQVQLLEAELSAGTRPRPDVVVFYDGFNDLTLQTQLGVHAEPTHLFFASTQPAASPVDESVAAAVRSWWADRSAVALAVERVRNALGDDEPAIQVTEGESAPIETIDPVAAADAALAIHRRGVDHVVALGSAYRFEPLFFWQPFLYTKDPLTPAEAELVGLPGYDTAVWLPMTDRVRAGLTEPVVDLSDALDGVDRSIYWDFVHTNEMGAALVADAILPHLEAALGPPPG